MKFYTIYIFFNINSRKVFYDSSGLFFIPESLENATVLYDTLFTQATPQPPTGGRV